MITDDMIPEGVSRTEVVRAWAAFEASLERDSETWLTEALRWAKAQGYSTDGSGRVDRDKEGP